MKVYMKKIAVYAMVTVLSVSSANIAGIIPAKAAEFDGDVISNPWESLFKNDSAGTGDLDVDNNNNSGNSNTNNGTGSSTTPTQIKKAVKTKVVSATKSSKKSKKAKIVLKKVSKAAGYQVKYSTSKKFKKAKTKTFKKNKFTIKKLKSGKKYYIKARAYGIVNNSKVYGDWSAKKAIKVKKKA